MTKKPDMQAFIDTLNEEELRIVKEGNERNKDELKGLTEEQIIEKIMFGLLWDYKIKMEYEQDQEKERAMGKRKKELYDKWKEMGLVKQAP